MILAKYVLCSGRIALLVSFVTFLAWAHALCAFPLNSASSSEISEIQDLTVLGEKGGVLNLHQAQQIALQANPSIVAVQARVEQARADVRQAVAAWWPSIDFLASGTLTRLSDTTYASQKYFAQLSGGKAEQTSEEFAVQVQAAWVLFDGFYRQYNQERAESAMDSSTYALRDARRLLVDSVATAFFDGQLRQTEIDIAAADATFYQRQLEDAQNRYDLGAGRLGDVLNIKVQLNSAITSLKFARRHLEAVRYGLAALMGLEKAKLPVGLRLAPLHQKEVIAGFSEDPQDLIAEALQARADIRQVELQVRQAEAGTGMAKAALYPRLQLQGSVNAVHDDNPGFESDDIGSSIGLHLVWNLFSGGADQAGIVKARQAQREARYSLANMRNQVAAEVQEGIAFVEAAIEQVRLQQDTVSLVEENRDLAREEYEAGQASLVRLNEAQRDLITTSNRLAQALVNYHQSYHRLLSAVGRNLESFELDNQ